MAGTAGELVGRVHELDRLKDALTASHSGNGSTVLISGPAGIGKTRLLSELAGLATEAAFEVLVGGCVDLVGTQLPYLPFVAALRDLHLFPRQNALVAGSQLQVFEELLARLTARADPTPVLLMLEDLHWADTSTLDLFSYLAHTLDHRRILLVGTCRPDEPGAAARMCRLAGGVRRVDSGQVLELGPLEPDEVTALLAARSGGTVPAAVAAEIAARSEGNPFFVEELLAAADGPGPRLPGSLRDVLLQRVTRLDRPTQDLLRVAAAAGREATYGLLNAVTDQPEQILRESLRQAVDGGVLVVGPDRGTFRFRHALLAEAIHTTSLPGESEDLHARLAEHLARSEAAAPAELATHWEAAGRPVEALLASVDAADQAQALFGLAEAHAHLERVIRLWTRVPDVEERTGLDLAGVCAWTAEVASRAGDAPRAVELTRTAIDQVEDDPRRAVRLHHALGRYLHEIGRTVEGSEALQRAAQLVPADPPTVERAEALAELGHGLDLAWRFDESAEVYESALAVARAVSAPAAEFTALCGLGRSRAYLGHPDEGLEQLWQAQRIAIRLNDPRALLGSYTALTDVLLMLGRPTEAARLAEAGHDAVRRYGIDSTILTANHIEALLAVGEWNLADRVSSAALRAITRNFPYMLLMLRAELEVGRGDFEAARSNLDATRDTLREDHGFGIYEVFLASLALWERRWTDAHQAVRDALERARSPHTAQLRTWFCAKGLRAQAELSSLARARRDPVAAQAWATAAAELIADARRSAAQAAAVTPTVTGWLALAEAEYQRAGSDPRPQPWSQAAAAWDRLERPPLAAYCRWRQAEALYAAGAARVEVSTPLRQAHATAARLGARPLTDELVSLARRARLDLTEPAAPERQTPALEQVLGLTRREAEVLTLVARGCTNRQIATELTISEKTANVHVSHILHKLNASNRREAAAIAHRVTPPAAG